MVQYKLQYTAPLEEYRFFPLAPARPVQKVEEKPKVEERIIPVIQYGPEKKPEPETRKFMFPFFGYGFTLTIEEQQARVTPEWLLAETVRMKTEIEKPIAVEEPTKGIGERLLEWAGLRGTRALSSMLGVDVGKAAETTAGAVAAFEYPTYSIAGLLGLSGVPRVPPVPKVEFTKWSLDVKKKVMGLIHGGEAVAETVKAAEPIRVPAPTVSYEEALAYGPRYFLGTLLGEAAFTWGVGKGISAAVSGVKGKATEWLTRKYVEKGPLAYKGWSEAKEAPLWWKEWSTKLVERITGAKPQLARGEVAFPVVETVTQRGIFPVVTRETLQTLDVAWWAAVSPRHGGIMITKWPTLTPEVHKAMTHLIGRGGEIATGLLKEEELGFKKADEAAKQLPFEEVKPVGSFQKYRYRMGGEGEFWFQRARLPTLTELAAQQKILPFVTQTQLTRMGVHPYIPALTTLPRGTARTLLPGLVTAGLKGLLGSVFPRGGVETVKVESEIPSVKLKVQVTKPTIPKLMPEVRPFTISKARDIMFPSLDLFSFLRGRPAEKAKARAEPVLTPVVGGSTVQIAKAIQKEVPQLAISETLRTAVKTGYKRPIQVWEWAKPRKKRKAKKRVVRYGRYKRKYPVATPAEFLKALL